MPVELVDIAAARLVLLVCIDTCKVCLLFPPTHPPTLERSMTVIPGVWAGHLCLFLQMQKSMSWALIPFVV